MQFFAALLSTVALAVSTIAIPHHVAERSELIAYSPRITEPREGFNWIIGVTELVCWDPTNIPEGATGFIILGRPDTESGSENLIFPPLEENYPLSYGCAFVKVPDVLPDHGYVVAVGSSGNLSPSFSIVLPPE